MQVLRNFLIKNLDQHHTPSNQKNNWEKSTYHNLFATSITSGQSVYFHHPIPIHHHLNQFQCKFMTERESRPKVIILRSFSWEHRVMVDIVGIVNSSYWGLGRKSFSCWGLFWRSCLPVYLLDRLVEGSSKLRGGRTLEREGDPNTNCKQLASILKRTVSMREKIVCGLQRGSSDHLVQPGWNGRFQTWRELMITTRKLEDSGGSSTKVWQTYSGLL